MTLGKKRIMTAYAFLFIPVLYFVFSRFFPVIETIIMGFTNRRLQAANAQFIGLDNFKILFTDEVFIKTISNTVHYTIIGVPLVLAVSLFIAIQLNSITRAKGFFRLIYLLPYVTPAVAVSWVWRWLFQPVPAGLINNLLVHLGIPVQSFLMHPSSALYSILAVKIWVDLGFCIIVFVAGLNNIPSDYIEAAKIDGASNLILFKNITLPLLFPVILFLLMREGISFLRIFTQIYNMTFQASGGPLDSTKSIVMFIYQAAFSQFKMGLAASASTVLFFLMIPIILLQIKYFNWKVSY